MHDDTGSAFPHSGKERSTEPNGSEEIDVELALRLFLGERLRNAD